MEPLSESRTRKKLTKSPRYLFFELVVRCAAAEEGARLPVRVLGALLEQFVGLELLRCSRQNARPLHLRFWRDPDGQEVDWVMAGEEAWLPVEVKWSEAPNLSDAAHLQSFLAEYPKAKEGIVVCRTPQAVQTGAEDHGGTVAGTPDARRTPRMTPATEQRKLAAIMFADMVGYSALSQRNEALAVELLEEHRRVVRDILPRQAGREAKTTGDGFLTECSSALPAVQCAVAVQQGLHERNQAQPDDRRVRFRIGICAGDVVLRESDIHGDGVNIAARIEPLAEPGGICVTNAVFEPVRLAVFDYLGTFYNRRRLHSVLGYITPLAILVSHIPKQPHPSLT